MYVADIGAHISYYTLLSARAAGRKKRVLAFEVVPSNFELLQFNLAKNRCQQIVTAENVAITDRARPLELSLSDQNTGDHCIFPSNAQNDKLFNDGKTRTCANIRGIALDGYLASHNITHIDVIKIGVEGAEWDAFQGMHRTLEQPHITMFMEFWPHGQGMNGSDPKALLQWLQDLNFTLLLIDREAEQLKPIRGDQFADYALTLDPGLRIDLIATRDFEPLLERLQQA